MVIGMVIVSFVQEKLFQAALIKEIYQIERERSPGQPPQRRITGKSKVQISPAKARKREKENFTSKDAKLLLDFEAHLFFLELVRRLRFVFTFKDMLLSLLLKVFWCRDFHRARKKARLFEVASGKLMQEFDAVNILRVIKQMEVLTGVFLNRSQTQMLAMQRRNVVEL